MYENLIDSIGFIKNTDPELADAMGAELNRQRRNIELIASENIVSPAVMATMGSVRTNKYAEGYSGKRYYGGCECVDVVETLAIERAKEIFGAEAANVQAHSGAQANLAVYFALLEPGDTVLGMSLAHGGHLTHGSPVNLSGKYYNFVSYGVDDDTHRIDYDKLRSLAIESKPKLIVAGASAYPRIIDFAKISEIAKEVGAYFMVDMAHIAGLVAAGLHPNPVPYADVVTSTTHKTLRGPRGGLILCKEELAQKIAKSVLRSGRTSTLEPMNPYERRIIHSAVAGIDGVTSKSIGEEPYRKVVISSTNPRPKRDGGKGGYKGGRNNRRNGEGQHRSLDMMKTSFEKEYKKPKPEDSLLVGGDLYGKIDI